MVLLGANLQWENFLSSGVSTGGDKQQGINMIINKEVRRRFGVENLEYRLRKTRLRWFGHVKRRDENSVH